MRDQPSERPKVPQEILTTLPVALQTFVSKGGRIIETEDEDWEVEIAKPPPYLANSLPAGSVLIAGNGCGDNIFLTPSADDPMQLAARVYVFWHEGPEIAVFAEDISALVASPPSAVTKRPPVFYYDGQTEVQLGDEVSARTFLSFFRRKPGRVVCVPGISKKNRDMEHHGLCWVALTLVNGIRMGTIVNPETSRLQKGIHFVKRSSEPFEAMESHERFE